MRLPKFKLPQIFPKITEKNTTLQPYKEVSQFAYNNTSKSHKAMKARNETLEKMRSRGFELDNDLSDRETSVFYNPTTKKVIVGYRGTALDDSKTRWKDLKSDFNILIGKTRNDQRFREATDKYKSVRNKYGDEYTFDVTGHSLGGALAKHVNDRHTNEIEKSVTFSRGSSPFHLQESKSNQIDVANAFDPVALGAMMENGNKNVDFTPRTTLGAHNLEFL
jgi:putative lipase involved disintegration of autophagic bodies